MIVERSTVEQQPFAKERNNLKQKLLAASAISACVASLYTFSHRSIEVSQICSENNIFSDYSMDISSSIKYDPTTGEHKTTKGEVSPSRIENLTSDLLFAINDPIMQLAIKNKSVDGITINLAQNSEMYHITEFGIYDDDANCGTNKEILLGVSSTEPNEQLGSPTNRFRTSLIIIHEAIHGLNHEWWRKIERTKVFDSPLDPKLYKLQNKCIAIYQWTTHKKRGEKLHEAIQATNLLRTPVLQPHSLTTNATMNCTRHFNASMRAICSNRSTSYLARQTSATLGTMQRSLRHLQ